MLLLSVLITQIFNAQQLSTPTTVTFWTWVWYGMAYYIMVLCILANHSAEGLEEKKTHEYKIHNNTLTKMILYCVNVQLTRRIPDWNDRIETEYAVIFICLNVYWLLLLLFLFHLNHFLLVWWKNNNNNNSNNNKCNETKTETSWA